MGYGEDELCRVGRDGIADPHDQVRWEAALTERDQRGSVEAELSFRRADGSAFAAEVGWTVFTDAAGEVRACLMLRDVTARRAAEAALRRSGAVLRRLIATSTDAFIAAGVDGRIREWNDQAEAIFGWTRDEALGRRLVDTVIPPDYRDAHTAGMARYLRGRSRARSTSRGRRAAP